MTQVASASQVALSSQTIRGYMEVSDAKFTKLAETKHEQLSKLLESAPASVANLAKLMYVATCHEDFELKGKGTLMLNTSFFGCLVQVTNAGCAAFVLANDRFTEIQMLADRMPGKINELVESIAEPDARKLNAESLATTANECADLAKAVTDKFIGVTALVDEIYVQFTSSKLGSLEDVVTALTEGMKQLHIVKTKWAEITKFFTTIAAFLRTDLVGDAAEVRSSASVNSVAQQKQLAKKVVKMCTTAVRVNSLATAYNDISTAHLESNVQELSGLVPDAKNNKTGLLQLADKCQNTTTTDDIKRIIKESQVALLENLRDEVKKLIEANF